MLPGDVEPDGLHLTPIGGSRLLLEPGLSLDISQREILLDYILAELQRNGGEYLYYDLGGLPVIDAAYYDWLTALAGACRLIGARLVCVHMQPTAAYALAHLLKDVPPFDTALSVDV